MSQGSFRDLVWLLSLGGPWGRWRLGQEGRRVHCSTSGVSPLAKMVVGGEVFTLSTQKASKTTG